MRVGQNPAKAGIRARQPLRLGVGIISYIPNQTGYHAESLQILKLELASLRSHTFEEFDLYLFDNGSCAEVVEELIKMNQAGGIDFLFLSHHNIGKFGAMNELIAAMPNEWIVYTDSDFYFRKGWLEESLKLAQAYPGAGLITAQPNIYDQLEGKGKAILQIDPNEIKAVQTKLDPAVVEDYCRGIGASAEMRQNFLEMDSTILEQNGVKSVYGACTAEYLGKREKLLQIFPLPHEFVIAREEDNELTRRVDQKGWLGISTLTPYVVHMGNHLDENLLSEAKADSLLSVEVQSKTLEPHKTNLAWKFLSAINKIGFMSKILKRIYVNLFELYSFGKK